MDIQFNHIKRLSSDDDINLNNSILILGRANNNNLSGEIIKAKNIDEIYKAFGDSELSRAADYVLSSDVKEVYLYNCYETANYISVVSKFQHYEFSYIVPVGINISDSFYNPLTKTNMLYAEFYLNNLLEETTSTIIMTDRHADLYEDLDHFLISNEQMLHSLKSETINMEFDIEKWTNLIYVSNMLANVEYSSIILACELINCTPGSYPKNILFGATYDYDSFDIKHKDMCYFKNNVLSRNTSIENLLNLRPKQDPYKSVLIDMVIKYIRRNLDLSKYVGRYYTKYTKIQIEKDVRTFMNEINGIMIENYNIKSIDFVLTGSSVGNVLIGTEITPRGTFEALQVNLEV